MLGVLLGVQDPSSPCQLHSAAAKIHAQVELGANLCPESIYRAVVFGQWRRVWHCIQHNSDRG